MNDTKQLPPDNVLWKAEDIATLLRCSARHVADRLSHTPGFPKARRITRERRWVAAEVKEWAGI